MRPAFLLTVLVVALLAFAAPARAAVYWTVVADDGTAQDVVNAANFAASMKASADVTFSGKTTSDVASSGQDLDHALLVEFSEGTATITQGHDADFEGVADVAKAYLRDQHFNVLLKSSRDTRDPAARRLSQEPQQPAGEPETDQNTTARTEPAMTRTASDEKTSVVADAPVSPPSPQQQAPPQEPGFFARLWRWFADLFS